MKFTIENYTVTGEHKGIKVEKFFNTDNIAKLMHEIELELLHKVKDAERYDVYKHKIGTGVTVYDRLNKCSVSSRMNNQSVKFNETRARSLLNVLNEVVE